jgi:hypothetical protein
MRILVIARNMLLFLVLTSPALLLAQFQQPTPEELKMTDDPKAPGAAAVYLNIEEIDNDPIHYQSVYVRIKVLQEKGKELATVEIPYGHNDFKVADIKARTIHSDGTVIPLIGKPEDLLIAKTVTRQGDQLQYNKKVFTLPSAEVGSILEYSYDIRYDDTHFSPPTWEVQRKYFVHKAHYLFTPFKAFLPGIQNATNSYLVDSHDRALNYLVWWPKLPQGVSIKHEASGLFILDVIDIPPAPDEEWMPPTKSFLYNVEFYYMNNGGGNDFWKSESKLWSKDVDHFAEPSSQIKQAVAGLIAPTDSDLDKAKKLYKAVQALDNTDYSRKKTESELKQLKLKPAKRAEDTWAQKSGDSEDIAMLYLAMLRAAGLTAYAMKVVDRDRGVFDPAYYTLYQLDNTIVILSTGGKEIGLDPGEKMCPFETVSWRHSLASGLRQGGDKNIATSPPQIYPDNKTTRTGNLTIDEHGAITGRLQIVMTGQEALQWRQTALRNDLDEVKKQFDHSLESIVPEGVEAHIDSFIGLDNPDVNLMAVVNVHGSLGAATAKRLILPAFFFQTRSQPFVNQEKRIEPVDMHYANQFLDQITYHLPSGMTVEGAPQDSKISWEGNAILISKSKTAPGQITIAHMLAHNFTVVGPDDYQNLRGFYQKVAAADQAQLVLAAAPPAPKGN